MPDSNVLVFRDFVATSSALNMRLERSPQTGAEQESHTFYPTCRKVSSFNDSRIRQICSNVALSFCLLADSCKTQNRLSSVKIRESTKDPELGLRPQPASREINRHRLEPPLGDQSIAEKLTLSVSMLTSVNCESSMSMIGSLDSHRTMVS